MYKLIVIQILCFSIINIEAQTQLDSFWKTWTDESEADSTRVKALLDYIYEDYFYTQPDSAIILGKVLYSFTKEVEFESGTVDALNLLGYAYFRTGDYAQALDSYEEGLKIADEIDDQHGKASLLLQTGYIYHDKGDIVTALKFYQQSERICEELGDKKGLGSVYNEYGSIYRYQMEYDKSLNFYLKSIAINNEINDEDGNAAMYSNIGDVYIQKNDTSKALQYYQKGYSIYKKLNDKLGVATSLLAIGGVYLDQKNEARALDYLNRSLQLGEEINYTQGIMDVLITLANIEMDRGQYSRSIKHCKRILNLSEKLGDIGRQSMSCTCLYAAYKALGNTKNALYYHEQMMIFEDSLQSDETVQSLRQMEFSNQIMADSLRQAEEQKAIELAHQEVLHKKDKNRNIAIGTGLFFLLLSGGFFSRWRYVRKSKRIIEKERDRSESLLLNILPAEIAEELKEKGEASARDFDLVSILFTDFKGFTEKSENLSAKELIEEINHCFMAFDHICEKYAVEKIKTIGDAYMAAGGLPVPAEDAVERTVLAALEMQDFIRQRAADKQGRNEIHFEMRVGIHTGPVVAGIVGVKKFQYDIWGDTVNTAARMESGGEVNKVNISQNTYDFIKENPQFNCQERGKIKVKGKNEMHMYFVERNKTIQSQ